MKTSVKLLHIALGVLRAKRFDNDLRYCVYAVATQLNYTPQYPTVGRYPVHQLAVSLGVSGVDACDLFFRTAGKGRLFAIRRLIGLAWKYRKV